MKAVLFDLFGVIARLQSRSSRHRIETVAGLGGRRFWNAYWARRPGYDRGTLGGAEYWHAVAADIGVTFDEPQVGSLIAADVASWSVIDDEVVAYVGSLTSAGTVVGLLSNLPEDIASYYERHCSWLGLFTVVGLSCRIGQVKPEPGAYLWCCQQLGMFPGDVLFVDDQPANVSAARESGLNGHLFTSLAELRPQLDRACE